MTMLGHGMEIVRPCNSLFRFSTRFWKIKKFRVWYNMVIVRYYMHKVRYFRKPTILFLLPVASNYLVNMGSFKLGLSYVAQYLPRQKLRWQVERSVRSPACEVARLLAPYFVRLCEFESEIECFAVSLWGPRCMASEVPGDGSIWRKSSSRC